MPAARLPLVIPMVVVVILSVPVPPVPVPPVPVAVPPVPVVVAVALPPVQVVALPLPLLEDATPLPAVIVVVPEGRPNAVKVVINVADNEPAPPRAPGPIAVVPPTVIVMARHRWRGGQYHHRAYQRQQHRQQLQLPH